MRRLAMMMLIPTMALGVTVGPLPQSEYADTEVSTNMPFAVLLDSMSRLEFTLTLDSSGTNSVEVSIGTDADGDGDLSLDETDYTVGCRCGFWFQRDAIADEEVEQGVGQGNPRLKKTFVLKKRKLDLAWNLVKVTRRGVAEIGEVVLVEGRKPSAALIVR